eukprot:c25226_g1_i2 orf=693-3995(-)
MFHKKHKNANVAEESDAHLHKGSLDPGHIHLGPASHHGIPKTSSKLAFDPAQRLLAIGTLDGKIKLIGNNGVEGILVSTSQSRCKFLEFAVNLGFLVNITAENDLQIWDLEKREPTQIHRWHANVTAFAVIPGSPFMYIGEDSGDIAILQYDTEEKKLRQMPYQVSIHATRGGITKSLNSSPSVVGILPFPETVHSRVLIAYSDGVILAWSITDSQVKGIRASTEKQLDGAGFNSDGEEDDNEKDICCMCWADPYGDLLAVGYTDGDIWLWDLAITSTKPASQSTVPSVKLQLSSDKFRSPVLALGWCAGGAREAVTSIGGHLFVYGGGEFGCSETLTVCSLKTASGQVELHKLEIPLEGLFEDMILLPGAGANFNDQASALFVLTSQGHLHAYDEASITKCLEERSEDSLPEPVPVNPFMTEPSITITKVAELFEDGRTADVFSQLPRHFRGNLPSVLPGGTKWPVTGGSADIFLGEGSKVKAVLVTGHIDGSVNVWDASTSVLFQLCNLPASISAKLPEHTSAVVVSHLEFCSSSGILVVARGSSVVSVYKVSAEPGEVRCIYLEGSEILDKKLHQNTGFQCLAILNTGVGVSSISISNHYAHVAVGHTDGTVLLFDPDLCSCIFHKISFSNGQKEVKSLTFGPRLKHKAASSPLSGVLYAVAEDSSVVALLYNNGNVITCGPWHLDPPSKALYMYCLELSNEHKDEDEERTGPSVKQCLEEPTTEDTGSQAADLCSCYLILCTQTSAHLYSCLVSNEMVSLTSLKEVPFSNPCSCASAVISQSTDAHGLVLLDNTATLEIRSLPNLDVVKRISLAGIYNLDPKVRESPTLVCSDMGLMALIDVKRELIMFSIFSADENSRAGDPPVSFFDKDVAAAGVAALKAGAQPPRRKSQLQGIIGGVLKDLKVGGVLKDIKEGFSKSPRSGKDQSTGTHDLDNLFKLFMSPLTAERLGSPRLEKASQPEITGSAPELDIDDIEIEDEEASPRVGSSEKVAASLKGKEKISDPADDRVKLLGDDEGYNKPVRRSPDEIRAKYGHKPLGDVSGAAGLARDKLLERQEKLQALGKRTEEMQDGAQNFASMAAELAKTMEGRKWWQL